MTGQEFYDKIATLNERQKSRDMEQYLLALYLLVLENKDRDPSLELFLELFDKAFVGEPWKFDPAWLKITEHPAISNETDSINFTLQLLRFHITEFHRMRGKQLEDKQRYFGVTSETGTIWYNFDPFTYLERGCCGMGGIEQDQEITWNDFADILEGGRVYE
ncbi:MAG: uncharacterized protein K0S32_3063 [Bacteroidetes bacterium]|jgi:hypothetical protein|nr:uncharacterized protein [Bacteroidota bacterium]